MKPTTLTVFELFEKERRYTVPLFQRPYVWQRQWNHLWADVHTRANAIVSTDGDTYALRKHFLGAVVLNHVKVYGRQVPAVEVIDGQQRLTTLQILLAALRDVLAAYGEDGYASTLRRVTENTCRMEHETERFKVWPTNADRETFERVLTANDPEEVKRRFPPTRRKWARRNDPRPRLVDAYLYFYKAIDDYIQPLEAESIENDDGFAETDSESSSRIHNSGPDRTRVDALVEAVSHHLELVIIELEERDDPQAIFESLNGLGEPLLPSDLIRNFVFQQAVREGLPTEELYSAHWSEFDKGEFWQAEERQGRLRRKRFDLFIFHYLISQTDRDLSISQLYQDFKDWWQEGARTVGPELDSLVRNSEYFRFFVEPDSESEIGNALSRLKAVDTGTIFPVLLATIDAWRSVDHDEVRKIFKCIESYLVRRMVCSLTAKNYNRVFLSLLKHLKKVGFTAAEVEAHLEILEGDSVRFPSDAEFQLAWVTTPIYSRLGPPKTRMILEALEESLRTKYQEDVRHYGYATVEHVMPQAWESGGWPSPEHADLEEGRALRDRMVHTIGNLTLLTTYLNPSVSNGRFIEKRVRIAEQSSLRLNAFFQSCGDDWSEEKILERGLMLFEYAKQVWPYPTRPKSLTV